MINKHEQQAVEAKNLVNPESCGRRMPRNYSVNPAYLGYSMIQQLKSQDLPRQYKPASWLDHHFEKQMLIPHPRTAVWAWLTDPKSFTRQVFPWRVEFTESDQDESDLNGANHELRLHQRGGFRPGVLNIHHGPLVHFAGMNTEISSEQDTVWVRDLHYFYGSFALNFRWIRPTRLRFEVIEVQGQSRETQVFLRVESYVCNQAMSGCWTGMQRLFWSSFPSAIRSGGARKLKKGMD